MKQPSPAGNATMIVLIDADGGLRRAAKEGKFLVNSRHCEFKQQQQYDGGNRSGIFHEWGSSCTCIFLSFPLFIHQTIITMNDYYDSG